MQLIQAVITHDTSCDPWQELANGIIARAADDYRMLGKKYESSECEERDWIGQQMKAISRFFLSDWYAVLSGCDNGADILERLDEEVFGNDD